jgi:hypothetical protein
MTPRALVGMLALAFACAFAALGLHAAGASAHGGPTPAPSPSAPSDLTVNDQAQPLDAPLQPSFGWQVNSKRGDAAQTAYEIRVARASARGTVWDSGKVRSDQQSYVDYPKGATGLTAGTSYSWSVRTWDSDGDASAWSQPAGFDTGIGDNDWSGAQWIRRVTSGNDSTDDYTLARRQYPAISSSRVVRARAYVTAMAQYTFHVDGREVTRGASFDYPGEGQYTATDITDAVKPGKPLALGAMYHYWTCTCQGRANGPASTGKLAAAASAGDTTIKVAAVNVYDVGDTVDIDTGANEERARVTAVGTAGATGTGLTLATPLADAHANGVAANSLAGPSGLLAKVVVEHANGTRETFVTDGSWRVAKDTAFTNSTITRRNSDAGDNAERYDATQEINGWDAAGFDDASWQPAYVIGTHPRPANPVRDEFSHLDPSITDLTYRTIRPLSVRTLADGTVIADFGRVFAGVPQLHIGDGRAGTALTVQTSYRLGNSVLSAATAAGDAVVHVDDVSPFHVGDTITVDQAGEGNGAGNPETRTVTAVGTARAAGTGITLDSPLSKAHAAGAYVEGERAGTSKLDTQGSTMTWSYTEKDGDQTGQAFTYWGWRYLQVNAPGAGAQLKPSDIGAVEQYNDDPADHAATFDSDNPTLNTVFDLLQRSGRDTAQETYLDTPTREKGGFLGDGIDISEANSLALGERGATVRAMREAIESQTHSWKATSSGYCAAAPCSFPSLGTPGRLNSVYPNGDNMRDIPDYTEAFPDWVWRYYQLTGDKQTLADAFGAMAAVSDYIQRDVAQSGNAAGLLYNLTGGTSSYAHGIIDWPAPMRYGYTFDHDAARTIHNAEAVGAFRATQQAAQALGDIATAARYGGMANSLSNTINQKLLMPNGLYTDGLSDADGNPQIANSAEQAQSYPLYFGVAPRSQWPQLADEMTRQGMHQGPMTWHVLLSSLAMAGRDDQVVKLLSDSSADGPARIVAENGTFMWEQWDPGCSVAPCTNPSTSSNESMSHGWGSTGIVDMIQTLMGVTVTSPGASTVSIAPPSLRGDSLGHVKGSVWTQRGTVAVDWTRTSRGIALSVNVPANQRAEVRIPGVTRASQVVAGGEGSPRFEKVDNGAAVFSVGSGSSSFAPANSSGGHPSHPGHGSHDGHGSHPGHGSHDGPGSHPGHGSHSHDHR